MIERAEIITARAKKLMMVSFLIVLIQSTGIKKVIAKMM